MVSRGERGGGGLGKTGQGGVGNTGFQLSVNYSQG